MSLFHSPSIVTSGLVLYFDAANPKSYPGSGTTWTDLSGNVNNGTLTNGPTFNSINNGVITLDGIDDYVLFNLSSTLSNFTFSMWVNIVAYSGERQLFSGASDSIGITTYNNNYMVYSGSINNSGIPITTGVWRNICVTCSGTNLIFYFNGSSNNTWNTGRSLSSGNSAIGTVVTSFSRNLNALISTAQIYNRALSAAEVLQNFNCIRGRFGV